MKSIAQTTPKKTYTRQEALEAAVNYFNCLYDIPFP